MVICGTLHVVADTVVVGDGATGYPLSWLLGPLRLHPRNTTCYHALL